MSAKLQTIIVAVSIFGLAAFFGCASFQDVVTPCYIPPASLNYADVEPTTFLPFTTLFDAKRVAAKMSFVHTTVQVIDNMKYSYLKGINNFHMAAAEELQTAVFSPDGPIGLLMPTLLGGSLGALLIKRPKDKTKEEYETAGKMNPKDFTV